MKSLNTKLALVAVAIAMSAAPAFAQRQQHQAQSQYVLSNDTASYANPETRRGSVESVQFSAESDVQTNAND